jgi:hypothetical protein
MVYVPLQSTNHVSWFQPQLYHSYTIFLSEAEEKQEHADIGNPVHRLKEAKQGELELEVDWYSVLDMQPR